MYGEVKSPLYPKPYPAAVYEEWELTVPTGYWIQLTFTHLDIEPSDDCYYDSLMKVLWKFCGQANSANGNHPGNQPILAPGSRLHLIFQADESNPGLHNLGFSVFYQAVDVDECAEAGKPGKTDPCAQICLNTLGSYFCSCHHGYDLRADQRTCTHNCHGGEFRELQGTLTSPGYPEPSPHGLQCVYNITVEQGFLITLNFSQDFHIEHIHNHQPSCLYHWLQYIMMYFHLPPVTIPGRAPQKLCGGDSPGLIHTDSHWVLLEYHTDWAGLSRGWRLQYTTQITDCGDPVSLLNGNFTFVSDVRSNQYLSVIEYRCNEPYYSFDKNQAVDLSKFLQLYVGNNDVHQLVKSPSLEVASVHVYPQFNDRPGNSNYDNDVALIKLVHPITFSEDVMPLCLPPRNSQYPTDTLGTVSGFGIKEGSIN
ncbi:hypothetical protein ACEWY4_020434 [Coilia grayii]|uniref:CUB domain-containing protein n=1 Tax=Coilia grayii TaxID=363190 RepID=A0ABD1JDU5_9TELE